MTTPTGHSTVFELDQGPGAQHPYDQIKQWITDGGFTHLEVTTMPLATDEHSRTTTGEIEIVESARRKPAQIPHIAAVGSERAIVIASPVSWPDQIDQPPFEEPVFTNPRITRLVGLR